MTREILDKANDLIRRIEDERVYQRRLNGLLEDVKEDNALRALQYLIYDSGHLLVREEEMLDYMLEVMKVQVCNRVKIHKEREESLERELERL